MKNKKKRLLIRSVILLTMVLAIGYTFYTHFSSGQQVVMSSGDMATNFVLEDLDGNLVELEELQGKGVYLTFWATYCTYCRQKMQYVRDHYDDFKDQGIEVLAVNISESLVQVERHQERLKINYPILLDSNGLVTDAYGVTSIPATFLIDENGRVMERQIGGKTEKQVIDSLTKLIPSS